MAVVFSKPFAQVPDRFFFSHAHAFGAGSCLRGRSPAVIGQKKIDPPNQLRAYKAAQDESSNYALPENAGFKVCNRLAVPPVPPYSNVVESGPFAAAELSVTWL